MGKDVSFNPLSLDQIRDRMDHLHKPKGSILSQDKIDDLPSERGETGRP